jgi:hypothetical protein
MASGAIAYGTATSAGALEPISNEGSGADPIVPTAVGIDEMATCCACADTGPGVAAGVGVSSTSSIGRSSSGSNANGLELTVTAAGPGASAGVDAGGTTLGNTTLLRGALPANGTGAAGAFGRGGAGGEAAAGVPLVDIPTADAGTPAALELPMPADELGCGAARIGAPAPPLVSLPGATLEGTARGGSETPASASGLSNLGEGAEAASRSSGSINSVDADKVGTFGGTDDPPLASRMPVVAE